MSPIPSDQMTTGFDLVHLAAGGARLTIVPAMGGGIGALSVGGRPVLREWAGDPSAGPFALAAIVLLPFSNRIGDGSFEWDGGTETLPPNVAGEAFPLHGDAHQRAWAVVQADDSSVSMRLPAGSIGPYRYEAWQRHRLSPTGLHWSLRVINRGAAPLPFGCGFHPWFPRDSETRLRFAAEAAWMNDRRGLAERLVDLAALPDWDFRKPSPLPAGLIDNGFHAWDGSAEIWQGPSHVPVRLTASPRLGTAHVYSPGANADFFCFEPVSHPTNAHNMPGWPGLDILAPAQSFTASMAFWWPSG